MGFWGFSARYEEMLMVSLNLICLEILLILKKTLSNLFNWIVKTTGSTN